MNDKIKEFVRESGLEIYGLGAKKVKWDNVVEKFTHLIVKDCALTASLMEREGRKNVGAQLLDNYGVEE